MSTQEMQKFMQQFKAAHNEHSALTTHTNVAQSLHATFVSIPFNQLLDTQMEMLKGENSSDVENYLDQKIAKMDPLVEVLRLLCLYSMCSGGIRSKKLEMFRKDIVQTYGFDACLTLDNLEELGMFTRLTTAYNKIRPPWSTIRQKLALVAKDTEKLDLAHPTDIAYTYGGYAPLSVRLVELAAHPKGWDKSREILNQLPGKCVIDTQEQAASDGETAAPAGAGAQPQEAQLADGKKPLTLVYFIGGVTFAEVSALRTLCMKDKREYLVATTKLINGTTLMQTVIEKLEKKLMKSTILGPQGK